MKSAGVSGTAFPGLGRLRTGNGRNQLTTQASVLSKVSKEIILISCSKYLASRTMPAARMEASSERESVYCSSSHVSIAVFAHNNDDKCRRSSDSIGYISFDNWGIN
jgi:hypothetical protein